MNSSIRSLEDGRTSVEIQFVHKITSIFTLCRHVGECFRMIIDFMPGNIGGVMLSSSYKFSWCSEYSTHFKWGLDSIIISFTNIQFNQHSFNHLTENTRQKDGDVLHRYAAILELRTCQKLFLGDNWICSQKCSDSEFR